MTIKYISKNGQERSVQMADNCPDDQIYGLYEDLLEAGYWVEANFGYHRWKEEKQKGGQNG